MILGDNVVQSVQTSSTHAPEVDKLRVQALAIKSFFGQDEQNFDKRTTVHAEGCKSDTHPNERLLQQNRGCRKRKIACTALAQLAMLQISNLGPLQCAINGLRMRLDHRA